MAVLLLGCLALPGGGSPAPWLKLAGASSFDDHLVGEAATASPNFLAYQAARDSADSKALDWLLTKGSPAARLYAALIAREQGDGRAFRRLLTDTAPVKARSGCEVFTAAVGEVARSFIRDGDFMGFSGQGPAWRPWREGKLAELLVEEQLYSAPSGSFSIQVAVVNLSPRTIGLAPDYQPFVNQWTTSNRKKRGAVDERRQPFKSMTPAEARDLAQRTRAGLVQLIEPGHSRRLLLTFNGPGGAADVDKRKEKFLILVLDGQVRVSDGQLSESVGRRDDVLDEADVAFPLPTHWRRAPVPSK